MPGTPDVAATPGANVKQIIAGTVVAEAATEVKPHADPPLLAHPALSERVSEFVITPYVIADGAAVLKESYTSDIGISAGYVALTAFYEPPEPLDISTGATARWLPIVGNVSGGGTTWQANNTADPDFVIIQTELTGIKPIFDYAYTYKSVYGPLARPALTFNNTGYSTINNEGTSTSATLIMVLVPHSGTGPYYNIFQANEGNPAYGGGEALAIRYAKGRLSVLQNNLEVVSHVVFRPQGFPIIVGVSIDAVNQEGRLVVVDTERTSKAFSTIGVAIVSFIGEVGSAFNYTLVPTGRLNATHRGDMDLLEVDFYDRAMPFGELEGIISLLALAYGLAT